MKKLKQKYGCMEEWMSGNSKTAGCPTKTFGHDRQYGFTLVELVIVIAIVIILSVISVPIYRGYVDKAKMAEGYALAGLIISAQKAYYAEHGNFLGKGSDWWTSAGPYEPTLGIDARGNKYFTWFTVNHVWYSNAEHIKSDFWVLLSMPSDLRYLSGNKPYLANHYYISSGGSYSYSD